MTKVGAFTPETARILVGVARQAGGFGSQGVQYPDPHQGAVVKKFVRFSLAAALTVDDASVTATIQQQYGPGAAHTATGAGSITVLNPAVAAAGKHQYHGVSGAYGWGLWHEGTEFAIIDLECP